MEYKSGFVTIIGRPNVGKSTLMNRVVGEKIAIMSDKPQTTRNKIQAIYTDDAFQIIFLDTPGIHKPKNKLGEYMTESAVRTLDGVDLVLLVVDDSTDFGPGDKFLIDLVKDVKTRKFLVINKIDLIDPDKFREIYERYDSLGIFEAIYGISATEGKNVSDLIQAIGGLLPEGPKYFPDDMVTDQPERVIVSEIIREKVLNYLMDEVPHGVAVEITSMKMRPNGKITDIQATIYCEKKSHKGIIIGKNGVKLKGIGKSARLEIETLLGTKVFLELWVKVKEGWRQNESSVRNFGYKLD